MEKEGCFGEINDEFKDFIFNAALLAGQTKDVANMIPRCHKVNTEKAEGGTRLHVSTGTE
jgi:hypothetical protein